MPNTSPSIYWNVLRLVQQVTGGTDGQSHACARHRYLRARAYEILLDMEAESHPDVPEDKRQLVNAQAATEMLLRLRSEGKHGTADRLNWRLDELAELYEEQTASGILDDFLPRTVSFLLHLRSQVGSNSSTRGGDSQGGGVATHIQHLSFHPTCATSTVTANPIAGALPSTASISFPETSASLDGIAAAAVFDGIPVGRRLRLQPPPAPKPGSATSPWRPAAPSPPFPHAHSTPFDLNGIALHGAGLHVLGSIATGRSSMIGGDAMAAQASGWFPFRDSAGLPLMPAFDAPLDELLLAGPSPLQRWSQPGGRAPQAAQHLTAAAGCSGGGGSGASLALDGAPSRHCLENKFRPHVDVPSAVPLLSIHVAQLPLVHTRFHHLNPVLTRLSGVQSECFRLPVEEAAAVKSAAATAQAAAAAAIDELSGVMTEDVAGSDSDWQADGALLDYGGTALPQEFPIPFALVALGVAAERAGLVPRIGDAHRNGGEGDGRALGKNIPGSGSLVAGMPSSGWLSRTRQLKMIGSGWGCGVAGTGRSIAEDEVLLYDMAVLALQGVASALWMLRSGMIRSHRVRLASQRQLLSQLCDTGELRLRLGNFVASYGTYGNASQGCGSASSVVGKEHDESLAAFSDTVRQLLAMYDSELQELASWHRNGLAVQPRGSTAGAPHSPATKATKSGGGGGMSAPLSSLCADCPKPHDVYRDQPSGPDGGKGGGGLLGLLLGLTPLRVHLQRLADVCMCVPDPAWIPPHTQAHASLAAGTGGRACGGVRREDAPQLAPSLWQVYGFPLGPELLNRLYDALLRTDHAKTPLLRLLFTAACMPYIRRMRAWMYDPLERGGGVTVPPVAPAFTAPLQRLLTAAGLQMRLLEQLSEDLGDVATRFRRMAAVEAEEACLIAQQYDEALTIPLAATAAAPTDDVAASGGGGDVPDPGLSGPDALGVLDLLGGSGSGLNRASTGGRVGGSAREGGGLGFNVHDEFHYPLVFGLEALQQLSEAAAAAAAVRDSELSSLLTVMEQRRRLAAEAVDERMLAVAQESLAAAEAVRAAKVAAATERRLARSRLLADQKLELDERAARARAERDRGIAEEQALAAEAVLREHNEAAAALAAELARLRSSYGGASYSEGSAGGAGFVAAVAAGMYLADERAAEASVRLRRCEWREARMALAARRRLAWQGIQAEELAQLRQVVAAARSAQAAAALPGPGGQQNRIGDSAAESLVDSEPQFQQQQQEDIQDAVDGSGCSGGSAEIPVVLQDRSKLMLVDICASEGAARRSEIDAASVCSNPSGSNREPPLKQPVVSAMISVLIPEQTPCLLTERSEASPRPTCSPESSSRGSPVVVAHISRPRRATFHNSGPSLPLLSLTGLAAAAATGATSPAVMSAHAWISDGGMAVRTPNHNGHQPRPILHLSGVKRSASVPSPGNFSIPSSPPAYIHSSAVSAKAGGSGAESEAGFLVNSADPWVRTTSAFLRPPSPAAAGRNGPPRGYMPSAWGSGFRGGAAGGLLLQLQRRHPRRRWAIPDRGGGAAGGTAVFMPQPSHQLGEDADASFLRHKLGAGGVTAAGDAMGVISGGGGGAEAAGDNGRIVATPRGPFGAMYPSRSDATFWASPLPGSDVPPARTPVAGPGRGVTLPSYPPHSQDGATQVQPRRRALWKVPSGALGGAVYDKTSAVGVLEAGLPASNQVWKHPRLSIGVSHGTVTAGWQDPVKALLRDYLSDPRVAARAQSLFMSSPLRYGGGIMTGAVLQSNHVHDVFSANNVPRGPLEVVDANRPSVTVGGGWVCSGGGCATADMSVLPIRRAPLSEDLDYAPVCVAVQTCLYGTVLAQYRLTTRAVWHVLVHEYRLLQYCEALRRFFFCEAGDVAGALADSLTRRMEFRPHVLPSTAELRAMLDEALHGCSLTAAAPTVTGNRRVEAGAAAAACGMAADPRGTSAAAAPGSGGTDGNVRSDAAGSGFRRVDEAIEVVQLLRVQSVARRLLGAGSYFASDVMYVTCKAPRPLDAVLTPDSMRDYADVFSLLLRVRCASCVLAACWARINAATSLLGSRELRGAGSRQGGSGEIGRNRWTGRPRGNRGTAAAGSLHPLWLKRLTDARLWLQAASQVVALIRQHLHVELQGRCWEGLLEALGGLLPRDLMQMREAHQRYLASAREVCMLPPRDAGCSTSPESFIPTSLTTTTTITISTGITSTSGGSGTAPTVVPPKPSLLPGAPLMEALQCVAALAAVLRRALTALEGQPAALSMPPRQNTVSPVLTAISRGVQAGGRQTAGLGGVTDDSGSIGCGEKAAGQDIVVVEAAVASDLDELWAHVVVCQGRLGRALGALRKALRPAGVGPEGAGVLGEMVAVLAAEPCRSYMEAVGKHSRG